MSTYRPAVAVTVKGFVVVKFAGVVQPVASECASFALSRRKQGFESPRERQCCFVHFDFSPVLDFFPKPWLVVWAILFAFRPSSLSTAAVASRS